jgi:hypothetical protein
MALLAVEEGEPDEFRRFEQREVSSGTLASGWRLFWHGHWIVYRDLTTS